MPISTFLVAPRLVFCGLLIMGSTWGEAVAQDSDKTVIAHRGASGYLPEHTLAAKAMAHAMGANSIEQDLVMTKDDRIVVLHDHLLDRVSNVQDVFPERHREDGRYYVIDFTLDEIRSLLALERFKIVNGNRVAVYPNRFPLGKSRFEIHTFEDEIELIQGLNHSRGKQVGLYPEIKQPKFHLDEGKDLAKAIVQVLKKYGYQKKGPDVFLQVFDFDEVKRLHDVILPSMKIDLNIVFLVNGKKEFRWITEPGGMQKVAEYADGVGPSMSMVVKETAGSNEPTITSLVKNAHQAGLVVHPYTFRTEANAIPGYASDFEDLLDVFFNRAKVDGLFTDFPDRVVDFLNRP